MNSRVYRILLCLAAFCTLVQALGAALPQGTRQDDGMTERVEKMVAQVLKKDDDTIIDYEQLATAYDVDTLLPLFNRYLPTAHVGLQRSIASLLYIKQEKTGASALSTDMLMKLMNQSRDEVVLRGCVAILTQYTDSQLREYGGDTLRHSLISALKPFEQGNNGGIYLQLLGRCGPSKLTTDYLRAFGAASPLAVIYMPDTNIKRQFCTDMALSQLGDTNATQRIVTTISQAGQKYKGYRIYLLTGNLYCTAPAITAAILPLLDHTTLGAVVAYSPPKSLRMCDLAADYINCALDLQYPFPKDEGTLKNPHYSQQTLSKIRELAQIKIAHPTQR